MDKTSIIEKINKEKLKLKIKQRNTLPGKPLISLTLINNIKILNLLTNFILAVWLIKKFILVAWPVERQGLLFSIVNRADFGKEYGICKGQLRKITTRNTFKQPVNYSVRILCIGSLRDCQEQFSIYGESAEFTVKFNNRLL